MALRWAPSALVVLSILFTQTSASGCFTANRNSNTSADSLIWVLGESVLVTWETDAANINVGFSAYAESDWIQVYNGPGDSDWTWTVDVNNTGYAAGSSDVYVLVANNADTNDDYFYSTPFYIQDAPSAGNTVTSVTSRPSMTVPTTPPTAVSTVVVASVSVLTQAANPTSTLATGKDPNAAADAKENKNPQVTAAESKLSSGTIAGIAVGAAAGVAALIAAIFFILRSKKLRKQLNNSEANTHAPYTPYDQLLPNSGAGDAGMVKDPGVFGAAAAGGAAAGAAAGYFSNEKKNSAFGVASVSETRSDSIMEMSADPIPYRDIQHADPVEIGGTELTGPRPMDEEDIAGNDSRPLMGEHPHDYNA